MRFMGSDLVLNISVEFSSHHVLAVGQFNVSHLPFCLMLVTYYLLLFSFLSLRLGVSVPLRRSPFGKGITS